MRKLATIRRVTSVSPIEGADKIELIHIDGWEVVTKKGEFKENDFCVYIEIDSILPEWPQFEFMRERKFRVKTIKLRGQISQGICFRPEDLGLSKYKEDDDVTDKLEIKKWEPYATKQIKKGNRFIKREYRPAFIQKTDECRIQNIKSSILQQMYDAYCYVTEKIDGSSMSIYIRKDEFGVCSRNVLVFKEDINPTKEKFVKFIAETFPWFEKFVNWLNNVLVNIFPKKYELEYNNFVNCADSIEAKTRMINYRKKYGFDFFIQGEMIGRGIQGNKYNYSDVKFRVFNIYNLDSKRFLNFDELVEMVQELGLDLVPIVSESLMFDDTLTTPKLVEMTKGKSVLNPEIEREGIVVRSIVEKDIPRFGRFSFKVINPLFLLKYDE